MKRIKLLMILLFPFLISGCIETEWNIGDVEYTLINNASKAVNITSYFQGEIQQQELSLNVNDTILLEMTTLGGGKNDDLVGRDLAYSFQNFFSGDSLVFQFSDGSAASFKSEDIQGLDVSTELVTNKYAIVKYSITEELYQLAE